MMDLKLSNLTMSRNYSRLSNEGMMWVDVAQSYLEYFTSSIQVIFGFLIVLSDVFLILVFHKNPHLKTTTNKYIFHYTVWHLIFTVLSSTFLYFTQLVSVAINVPMIVYYLVLEIDKLSLLLIYLFMVGLAVDWLFSSYNTNLQEFKFNVVYSKMVYIIYGSAFVYFIVQFTLLLNNCWLSRSTINEIIYFSILLFISVLNFFSIKQNRCENSDKTYSLTIATIVIFFWLPLKLYRYFLKCSNDYDSIHAVFVLTSFLPQWMQYSTNIVIVIMLRQLDTKFKKAYYLMFHKKVKKSGSYYFNKNSHDSANEFENVAPIEEIFTYI